MISKANKGDVTVVLTTSKYLELAYKHLGDKDIYQLLKVDPTQEIVARFNSYLNVCLVKG